MSLSANTKFGCCHNRGTHSCSSMCLSSLNQLCCVLSVPSHGEQYLDQSNAATDELTTGREVEAKPTSWVLLESRDEREWKEVA